VSPRKEPRVGPLPAEKPVPPAVAAAAPPEKKVSLTVQPHPSGPHWKGRGIAAAAIARKERDAKAAAQPRDYAAEAKATLNAADQNPTMIAAVINAQALERLGKTMLEAAAIANYKRES
jgi:hypothetical protein